MPDDKDDNDNAVHFKGFGPEYTPGTPEYNAKYYITFLDNALRMLQPDLFVSNARNIELSCKRLPVKVFYDPFDGTYRIDRNGEIAIANTGRQVRSQLLVPIANSFGYEAHRDHFDDFIESVKNDKARHYDSLIQYYDSFAAQYVSDFKCIDEMVDICDTDNDDYTREELRSFVIGHIQRAYFPGCELQRIIILIGDENAGKSSLIKIKAGNLLWDAKGGIKALRWYSNKSIINPLMSDRDRHSACIAVNMFEFDERRGQRAIENEHFRSFVTSTYDDFRIWMAMEPVRVLRRWDMVASTNHGDYNSDGFIRRDWGINVGVHGRRINLPTFVELYPKLQHGLSILLALMQKLSQKLALYVFLRSIIYHSMATMGSAPI
jgi:Virulence-associated protein E-like domain